MLHPENKQRVQEVIQEKAGGTVAEVLWQSHIVNSCWVWKDETRVVLRDFLLSNSVSDTGLLFRLEALEMGEGSRETYLCSKCLTGCTAELETKIPWNVNQILRKLNKQ